ncbi:40S ribosomal protein S11-like [Glycine soja]|uniref:40S ribosomal protein S11-like n=1 Tax=Glycine max TaxID=3847 RepID=UPI0003DE9CF0|nr:40S ribosomal protein S11-like [Glycine max]XP_028186619.1 40S ribosomal protein S11-like [Glycine soja]|eukprot:XP_006575882.1 40S ribosomal protein S11-like [Glycine max]
MDFTKAFNEITERHLKKIEMSSKKTRKGKSPGKGGNRFWKSIVVGFKTPREFFFFLLLPEFIFVANWPALPKGKSPGKGGNRFWKSIVVGFKTPREAIEGDFFVFFSRCQGSLLIVFCVLDCVFERMIADLVFTYNHYFRKANCVPLHPRDLVGLKVTSP